jgi:hypothetical protein
MYSMTLVTAVISAVVIAVHLYCLGVLFDCQLRHCSAVPQSLLCLNAYAALQRINSFSIILRL